MPSPSSAPLGYSVPAVGVPTTGVTEPLNVLGPGRNRSRRPLLQQTSALTPCRYYRRDGEFPHQPPPAGRRFPVEAGFAGSQLTGIVQISTSQRGQSFLASLWSAADQPSRGRCIRGGPGAVAGLAVALGGLSRPLGRSAPRVYAAGSVTLYGPATGPKCVRGDTAVEFSQRCELFMSPTRPTAYSRLRREWSLAARGNWGRVWGASNR